MKGDVIERLRAANPVLDCPPPPIDGVWQRIENIDVSGHPSRPAGLSAQAGPGGRRGRRRPSVGNALATVAIVAAGAVAVAFLALLGHPRSAPSSARPTAPAATGTDAQAGRLVGGDAQLTARLRALQGSPVVVTVWASWCEPCREDLAAVDAATAARQPSAVAFLGVDTSDTAGAARAFLARTATPFPTYRASVTELGAALPGLGRLAGLPTTIYIGRAGRVVHVSAGAYASAAAVQRDITTYLHP